MRVQLRVQIELMRRHRNALQAMLQERRDEFSGPEVAAIEHAVQSYTDGANMLEEGMVFWGHSS